VGFGAIVGFVCVVLRVEEQYGRLVYRGWFWFAIAFLCLSAWMFWRNYIWICEEFPDGYVIS
jgi:hypothetical protein